jgi:hypothetical protein
MIRSILRVVATFLVFVAIGYGTGYGAGKLWGLHSPGACGNATCNRADVCGTMHHVKPQDGNPMCPPGRCCMTCGIPGCCGHDTVR